MLFNVNVKLLQAKLSGTNRFTAGKSGRSMELSTRFYKKIYLSFSFYFSHFSFPCILLLLYLLRHQVCVFILANEVQTATH